MLLNFGMKHQLVSIVVLSFKFKTEFSYMLEINVVKYKLFSISIISHDSNKVVNIPLVGHLKVHVLHIEHPGRTLLRQKILFPSKYLRRLLRHPHVSLQKYCSLDFNLKLSGVRRLLTMQSVGEGRCMHIQRDYFQI